MPSKKGVWGSSGKCLAWPGNALVIPLFPEGSKESKGKQARALVRLAREEMPCTVDHLAAKWPQICDVVGMAPRVNRRKMAHSLWEFNHTWWFVILAGETMPREYRGWCVDPDGRQGPGITSLSHVFYKPINGTKGLHYDPGRLYAPHKVKVPNIRVPVHGQTSEVHPGCGWPITILNTDSDEIVTGPGGIYPKEQARWYYV